MKSGLVAGLVTGVVLLSSAENAYAVPNFNSTSFFSSAGTSPSKSYMDQAGTWNNTLNSEATDTSGDRFVYTFTNTGPDTAFDFDLSLTVPAGFRLPAAVNSVNIISLTPGNCSTLAGISVNQGSVGGVINFSVPNNRDIPASCTYQVQIGLTTNDTAPFASSCNPGDFACDVQLDIEYNEINNDFGSQQIHSSINQARVNTSDLTLVKTAITTVASNGQQVDFQVDLISSGTGGVFDVVFTDTLSPNLTNLNFVSVSAFNNTTNAAVAVPSYTIGTGPFSNQITFNYIPANVRVEIDVQSTATVDPTDTTCPDMTNDATAIERTGVTASDFATVDFTLEDSLQLTHDLVNSFCELCGIGTVRLAAENVGGISLVNISLTENLMASGLTYVSGSTQISIDGGAPVAASDPVVSGANGQILNWTPTQVSELSQLDSPFATSPPNPISIEFIFQVERAAGFNEEGLTSANRNIQASADYDLICGGISQSTTGTLVELPIRQAVPQTFKLGRNLDAGQGAGSYAALVYGHVEDSVIWRIEVQNTGQANLEDLLMDDTIGGNFDINWVCNSEAAATTASLTTSGAAPAGCVSAGSGVRTSVLNFAVDDPFGNPANDENTNFVDVTDASSGFIYYVGRIQSSCTNQTNTANIEWGCEADSPPEGGLVAPGTNSGVAPAFSIASSADLSAQVITGNLDVQQSLTGINVTQPVGSSGLVTIQITNLTGATVRNIDLTDTLPTQYVIDHTYVPTAIVTPAYGTTYLGMIDTITWDNEDVGNRLNNIAPYFTLTSSTSRPVSTVAGDDVNLLRHGDVLTIQFRIVLIDATRYDLVADLDITPEAQGDSTDPDSDFTVSNTVHVNFDNVCGQTGLTVSDNVQAFPADIEDLDVAISDALFILTNDAGTPLPLNVLLTNNGGHDADNYAAYITFGEAMTIDTVPAGCVATTNPPPHPHWNQPAPIPASAAVYACDRGVIAPGATETITFTVIKASSTSVDDDLTFRADVVGEVTLSDGAPLIFPTPANIANTTPNTQLANNYSLDAVRSRVLGFNLTKNVWYCTESGTLEPSVSVPPPATPAELNIQIGEDCNYFIESGGWFGFLTPGFTLIAVENVLVTDDLPDGQGMIHFDGVGPYDFRSTANIILNGADGGAVTTPLGEADISWSFNTTGNGISIKDEFFRVNLKTRLLNDQVDLIYPVPGSYAPNLHANISTNIARTSFDAIFNSDSGNVTISVSDSAGIPGYPIPAVRQVDLTEIEPNIIVTKEVCNEALNGVGTGCSRFRPLINSTDALDAGDSDDNYIYRVSLTNEASSGSVARAPAYNVIVTDILDNSDLMLIAPGGATPFNTDGLDNDGDGLIDGADTDGEFFSLTENLADGVTPATFVISHDHSNALDQINPGQTVTFYYRIDPDQDVAPLQALSNTVTTRYDSLEGDFGNQNSPQLTNAETTSPNNSGRARIYTAIDATASVEMLPLETLPKQIIQVSNSAISGPPQEVVAGEEILYELHAQIPIAKLRNFIIRDELPPGLRCVDTQTVNLNAAPYSSAQFRTNGAVNSTTFSGSCDPTGASNVVQWSFGDQELTAGAPGSLFDFRVRFIARVENTNTTVEGCNIRNGGTDSGIPTACSTDNSVARLTYVNESASTIILTYDSVDVIVREPVIDITKSFLPVVNADGDDILDVTVTATNTGSATAYNLQVLDDLTGKNITFLNLVGGTDPPDNIDVTTLGANQPIFSWDPGNADFAIASLEVKSFTFRVQIDDVVEPHEILDNTIEARWTSLPNTNAINDIDNATARTIGADGDALGMRNGQLTGVTPVSTNPPNDYIDSATASVLVPGLSITKTDLNSTLASAIGAQKQFQIVIDLPEGITNNCSHNR